MLLFLLFSWFGQLLLKISLLPVDLSEVGLGVR